MTHAKYLLLSATCALAVAFGTPAFALNPQPLPPGYQSHLTTQMGNAGHTAIFCRKAGGNQAR